jgi:hypothetical protein
MDCICSYIVANANALLQALQNRNRNAFCDNTGCYEDSNILYLNFIFINKKIPFSFFLNKNLYYIFFNEFVYQTSPHTYFFYL